MAEQFKMEQYLRKKKLLYQEGRGGGGGEAAGAPKKNFECWSLFHILPDCHPLAR